MVFLIIEKGLKMTEQEKVKKLEEENRKLRKGLDLLLKTAIHNKQGNSIVVTDDLMRLSKEQGDD